MSLYDDWQARMNAPPSNTTPGVNDSGRSIVTSSDDDGYNPYAKYINARSSGADAQQYGQRGGTGFNVKPPDYTSGMQPGGSNQGNKQFVDLNNDGINDSYNNNYLPDAPPGRTRGDGTSIGNDPNNRDARGSNWWSDLDNYGQGGQDNGDGSGLPPDPPPGGGGTGGGGTGGGGYDYGGYGGDGQFPGLGMGEADYDSVRDFSDQAYEEARRTIDPQQEQQRRRMEQDLVNKGIDPSSEQGMAMLDQQSRNFSDQDNSATFGAMQFGQGIQNQTFGQTMAWQGQDFNQMMGLEGLQFRNRQYGDSRSDYQDALTMAMLGMTPIPGVGQNNPGGSAYQGYDPGWLARLGY